MYQITVSNIMISYFRCIIPECENSSTTLEPPWLPNAIPQIKDEFESCRRFSKNETKPRLYVDNSSCPSSFFDTTRLENCDGWVYEHGNSIVKEVSIYNCQNFQFGITNE